MTLIAPCHPPHLTVCLDFCLPHLSRSNDALLGQSLVVIGNCSMEQYIHSVTNFRPRHNLLQLGNPDLSEVCLKTYLILCLIFKSRPGAAVDVLSRCSQQKPCAGISRLSLFPVVGSSSNFLFALVVSFSYETSNPPINHPTTIRLCLYRQL